ncbi:response regulator transcription factor [Pseudodesulfovibrio tunisiensis]|uniref:response regulator transcription factor n=1 Tax=Pseudodesulfovibrio tunisiensis TaxID=463192 RepID=UPI001FB4C5CA|nr:response regulator [Pseudodesulfovibrio tunisiensis]
MRILLVDDEAELVSAMAERLAMRGYDAHWADNANQAVSLAGRECYDVAVLDMKMPRVSGLELRKMLSSQCPDTRFIFLSGHGSEEDFMAGSAKAESYLIKPVRIEDLIARIEEAVNQR